MKNRVQAMGTTFICSFIPLIGPASVIISAFVTLCRGASAGAYILAASMLPFLLGYALNSQNDADFVVNAVLIVLASNFLTWAFAVILARTHSWSLVIQLGALLCILIVSIVHLYYPDIDKWWETELTTYFNKAFSTMGTDDKQLFDGTVGVAKMVSSLKYYATGYIAAFVVFYALLQMLFARWWQSAVYKPGALRSELYNIRLSNAAAGLFCTVFIFSFWDNKLITDLMPIFYLTFGLAGLSLIHCLIHHIKGRWIWISLLYLILSFFPQLIVPIAIMALMDVVVDFRKRVNKPV